MRLHLSVLKKYFYFVVFTAGCFLLGQLLSVHATTFTRPLVEGSTGSDVTALQQILVNQGYLNTTSTGYYGPLTAKAVADFQTAHGIEALGGVGPLTRTVLNALVSSNTQSTPSSVQAPVTATNNTSSSSCTPLTLTHALDVGAMGSDVTALQQFLVAKGYLTVSPTGYFGSLTAQAVARFQTANSIEAIGGVGPLTRSKIAAASNQCAQTPVTTPVVTTPIVTTPVTTIPTTQTIPATTQNTSGGGGGVVNTNPVTTPDTTPPTISFSAPGNGATVSGSVILSASASDNVGISSVTFKVDGATLSTNTSASYSTSWNSTSDGSHTLVATAMDIAGNTTSASITVTVDNTPPTLSAISSGTPGQTSASITWTTGEPADSQVSYGTTASYGANTTLSSTLTTSHTQTVSGLSPNTTYHYRVRSADAAGNISLSSDQTFTTSNTPDTTAPSVSLIAPSNGATVSGSAVVLSAIASDNIAVAGVTFYVNGVRQGSEDTTSPYSVTWDSTAAANGSQTILAVARDTSHNYTTSTSISVTVNNGGGGQTYEPDQFGTTWQPLKVGAAGFLTGMSIANDGTMVVRTDTYGAYIWNSSATLPQGNAGGVGAWQQLVNANSMPASFVADAELFATGVYEIQIAPSNSNDLYMSYVVHRTNTYPPLVGVYKSTDKGLHWTETSFTPLPDTNMNANGTYRTWGPKMAINPTNPNNVFFGTGANGLFVTNDGGGTWSQVNGVPASLQDSSGNYPGINAIVFDPGNSNVVYAASYGNGIYQTTNGGTTWTKINNGSGPANVTKAAVSSTGTNGTYFASDTNGALWVYTSSAGTWTQPVPLGYIGVSGIAVDPHNQSHIVITSYSGNLNESMDNGVTWSGWSENYDATYGNGKPTYVANDIPWLASFGTDSNGLHFDPTTPGKLYVNGDRAFWTTTLTSAVTKSSTHMWTDQSVGIEQLASNWVLASPAYSTPLVAAWDTAVIAPNLVSYPSTFGPVQDTNVVAGWSIDYASSNPSFVAILADGLYAGGPQRSSYTTNGGQTWTAFPTIPPGGSFGGNIAVSTPTNFIFAAANGVQPYYTQDGGNSWHAISLPGVTSWSNFMQAYFYDTRVIAADRVLPNTFYLDFDGIGFFRSTDGGATWTMVSSVSLGPPAQLKSTPGYAGDLWMASGSTGNAGGGQGVYGQLMHSTDGGVTWTTIPGITEPYTVGFGAPAPGQTYPAVYIVGWVSVNGTRIYGVWESDNQGVTWRQVGQWPGGSLATPRDITGDPNIYGRMYITMSGSGYVYGDTAPQ